jgi:hypothetical protein
LHEGQGFWIVFWISQFGAEIKKAHMAGCAWLAHF